MFDNIRILHLLYFIIYSFTILTIHRSHFDILNEAADRPAKVVAEYNMVK